MPRFNLDARLSYLQLPESSKCPGIDLIRDIRRGPPKELRFSPMRGCICQDFRRISAGRNQASRPRDNRRANAATSLRSLRSGRLRSTLLTPPIGTRFFRSIPFSTVWRSVSLASAMVRISAMSGPDRRRLSPRRAGLKLRATSRMRRCIHRGPLPHLQNYPGYAGLESLSSK